MISFLRLHIFFFPRLREPYQKYIEPLGFTGKKEMLSSTRVYMKAFAERTRF